ncbi:unnamed protein product [Cylindrotheca closterium]|uniref:beta-N-acetylhexosaminidase n=1 Tax=Cylindrotheca closterium TaxID=2856 RepID=A0AAD2G563_9STRA|nr:unnamed protein product [Cylindrotheca closterium]
MLESRPNAVSLTTNIPTTTTTTTTTTYDRSASNGGFNNNKSPRRSTPRRPKLNSKTSPGDNNNFFECKMKKCNRRKFETCIFGALALLLLWLNLIFLRQYPGYHQQQQQQHNYNQHHHHHDRDSQQPQTKGKERRIEDLRKQQQRQTNNVQIPPAPISATANAGDADADAASGNNKQRPGAALRNPTRARIDNTLHRRPRGHSAPRAQSHMEFNWRRSKYAPPENFMQQSLREEPNDYWTGLLALDGNNSYSNNDNNSTFKTSIQRSLNFTRSTPYLGVLIDAGRHYFELDWLYHLMDLLHLLQYNWVHFRLTDDQTFNLQLKSWPQLAIPTPYHNQTKVYQPDDLRNLVKYARERNIAMIPEINIPGHAGAWAGIPGLVVPCPNFICQKGYGLPLNVNHPQLPQILKDVLSEVLDIFDQPPYLHLGGDEIEMSKPCFQEVNQPIPNYIAFEEMLKRTLQELVYDESKVIRWEMTLGGADPKGHLRAGRILQWWFQIPGEKHPVRTRPDDPFVASSGLYMDANEDDGAWEVFLHARKWMHLNYDYKPQAIVVGTFELDQEFWFDRNVVGKLLATAMGASNEVQVDNGSELYEMYKQYCTNHLHFPDSVCNKYAKPNLPSMLWKEPKWRNIMWKELREGLCDRLTTTSADNKSSPAGMQMKRQFRPEFMFPS